MISDTAPRRESFVDSTNSTRKVLNRFDLNGDGIISQSEANLMANANVLEENEKKKYKFIAIITIVLLVLTLTANFGLTIATIYLTRQFDIVDGTLVDKSTGEQLTTKTHGNLVAATLFGEIDGAGRLLTDNICFSTASMDEDMRETMLANYLNGESVRYTATVNGQVENGVVKFIDTPRPVDLFTSDPETWDGELDIDGFGEYLERVFEEFDANPPVHGDEVDPESCVLYHEVVCAECAATGDQDEFFMWCCGTTDQALFGTGNCCVVSYEQLDGQQDTRRLGKCTSAKRRRGGF